MPQPGRAPERRQWQRWQHDERFIEEMLQRRERQQFRMPPRARLVLPVILALVVQLPASLFWLVKFPTDLSWLSVVLAVLGPLALLLVRRLPGPVVAFESLAACVDFFLSTEAPGPPYLALAFGLILSITHGARIWAWVSVGTAWVATVVIGLVLELNFHPARIALTTLGILVVFGMAEGLRNRREHFSEMKRIAAQRKQTEVQAERVRIARELHDVLAHSLSQINVQAGVGLHLMDKQPDKAAEALRSIKETSKTALDEVRSVLGVLRAEGGQDPTAPLVPEPDLSRLPGLVASVTSQGVEVTLTTEVETAPKAVQLAIYRIVQESLTNVVRHSGATTAAVRVAIEGHDYVVSVADDGHGISEHSTDGRGLLGMRERAELLGGTLATSESPTGGLLITARIPVKEVP